MPMAMYQKLGILTLALAAFGAVRMPLEQSLTEELTAVKLLSKPIGIGTREHIGQTSSVVALGGLRTLVATFLNLRAFTFFTEQKWDQVAETYDTIVDLAPNTRYYWESGSHHSAYNAASYYINDSKLPALRRREAWKQSILRGKAFLERGIRNNPLDWSLSATLGFLLSDSNKIAAFGSSQDAFLAAAAAYRASWETGKAPSYIKRSEFYCLARLKGREAEALKMARELYQDRSNQLPTVTMLFFVLEAWENPQRDHLKRALELYPDQETAYDAFCTHWLRTREGFPIYGVANMLEQLEKSLKIPPDKSIFKEKLRGRDIEDWFDTAKDKR